MKKVVCVLSVAVSLILGGVSWAKPAVEAEIAAVAAAPVVVGNKVCPVSGQVIPADALGTSTVEYNGKVYNLCCPDCKEKFLAEADKFTQVAEAEVAAAAAAVTGEAVQTADEVEAAGDMMMEEAAEVK